MNIRNQIIVQNIKKYAEICGTNIKQIEKDLKFGNGTIGKWKNAPKSPPLDKIEMLAVHLGVSVAALSGETGAKENSPGPEAEGLSEADNVTAELMSLWRAASPEQKQLYLKILKAMEDEHAEK